MRLCRRSLRPFVGVKEEILGTIEMAETYPVVAAEDYLWCGELAS